MVSRYTAESAAALQLPSPKPYTVNPKGQDLRALGLRVNVSSCYTAGFRALGLRESVRALNPKP